MELNIQSQILLVDQTIDMLRTLMMKELETARGPFKEKIDLALDHRLKLMQARDSKEQ